MLEAARGAARRGEPRDRRRRSTTTTASSRRAGAPARSLEGLVEGAPLPAACSARRRPTPLVVPYEVGRPPRDACLPRASRGDHAAYEELRAGFTAAVSHELRTPLARLLALLETRVAAGRGHAALLEQARAEVERDRRADRRRPLPQRARDRPRGRRARRRPPARRSLERGRGRRAAESRRARRASRSSSSARTTLELPLRPRMLRVIVENLVDERDPLRRRRVRRFTLSARREGDGVCSSVADDGPGSPTTSCRASSSASTAPTAPAPRGAPGSARDRQAHRRGGRRDGRGRRARPGRARGHVPLPLHRSLTIGYDSAACASGSSPSGGSSTTSSAAPRRTPSRSPGCSSSCSTFPDDGTELIAESRSTSTTATELTHEVVDAPEPDVRDAVRPRRHLPARHRARRHLRPRRRGGRQPRLVRRHRDPATGAGSRPT